MRGEQPYTCDADGCQERAVFHLTWARMRQCTHVQHFCDKHAKGVLLGHDFYTPVGVGEHSAAEGARSFDIDLVVISEVHDQQVVYLKEVGGRRFFPMLVGSFEALRIDRELQGVQWPRPLTHDALVSAIEVLGGVLEGVTIDKLEDMLIDGVETKCYFARLRICRDDELVLLDVRPSDAVAVALIVGKPIFVEDSVLEQLFA